MHVLLFILIIIVQPSLSLGAIDCNDPNSVKVTHAAPSDPETIPYTTPAGSNQVLFVGVGQRTGAALRTHTQTHAGNALNIITGTTEQYTDPAGAALYYIVSPTSGTNNVIVDWNAAPLADGIVIFTCSGVDTTSPFRSANAATGSSTTASSAGASGQSGDVMVDFAFKDNPAAFTRDASQTSIQEGNDGAESAIGSSFKAYTASTTMQWTLTSEQWAHISAVLKPAASPSSAHRGPVLFP